VEDQAHDAPVGPERELSHRGVDPADGHAFSNVEGWPGSPVYPFTWPPIGRRRTPPTSRDSRARATASPNPSRPATSWVR
jgi:hypothetical protein